MKGKVEAVQVSLSVNRTVDVYIVDGKLSRVKELADGRVAYWRGPEVPAAILTLPQLEEVQRLNARRLLLPYGFVVFAASLAFLSFKGQAPLAVPVFFGALAMLICAVVDVRARRQIEEILRQAPTEDRLPPYSSVASRFRAVWQGWGSSELRLATWFTGAMAFSSAFCLFAKVTGIGNFDPSNEIHPLILLLASVVSFVLFRFCLKERRRRRLLA